MKKFFAILCVTGFLFSVAGISDAALIDRGGGMIYDTVSDITLLQNANLAGGVMLYNDAYWWAHNLTYGGHSDWRLPVTAPFSPNPAYGELHHLFHNEGIRPSPSSGPFSNVMYAYYWTQTINQSLPSGYPIAYHMGWGIQNGKNPSINYFYAWAVADGDIAVPIPGAIWLLGAGLVCLVGIRRKFQR